MFLHNLKYEIKMNLRAKEVIIWMLLFPCVLSVLYKAAFGNLYENGGIKTVSVAVVENHKDDMFRFMMSLMGESESTYKAQESNLATWMTKTIRENNEAENTTEQENPPLFHAIYCTENEAYKLLGDGDVRGIIFVDTKEGEAAGLGTDNTSAGKADDILSDDELTKWGAEVVRGFLKELGGSENTDSINEAVDAADYLAGEGLTLKDMIEFRELLNNSSGLSLKIKSNGMEQSSIKRFLEMYGTLIRIAGKLADNGNASGSSNVMDAAVIEDVKLTKGNTDPFVTYMYNMIAMVALFGMTVALHVALFSEANLSDFGARRSCSATPKIITILAGLCACCLTQIFCVCVCISFQAFVLKVNFGERLPLVYLGGAIGAVMGVSMGFFVGAIGRLRYEAKIGISMAVVMTLSFMSGLMVSGIKGSLIMHAPLVNDLNPVAIVADSFYYLSVDAELNRYWGKLAAMCIYTLVFIALGSLLTRRRKYESL